jgi:hypothetical protein
MRNAYLRYCLYFGRPSVPASKETIVLYMVFLARSLSPASIPGYMNVVRLMHLEAGVDNPLNDWQLNIVRRGILRQLGRPPRQKLPITPAILLQLLSCLDMHRGLHMAFWCACLVGFFAFFRKSTLLPKSTASTDAHKALCLKDVQLSPDGHSMQLTVRHSKTIQFGQRTLVIPFHQVSGSPLCPVRAMSKLLANMIGLGPSPAQPLFSYYDSTGRLRCLTHTGFVGLLKTVLAKCGLSPSNYSGHSLRRGGCSYAFSLGISPLLIKLRGDWRSNAYERYVTLSADQHAAISTVISKSMHSLMV